MSKSRRISVEIDKLTKSIENTQTGESLQTLVLPFAANDSSYKKSDWLFDWKRETRMTRRVVFKLVAVRNQKVIQGLISVEDNHDHFFLHLIETAGFNRGKRKHFRGVAGNLVAYACKLSFERGYDGVVSFVSKTRLVKHYEQTLGAEVFRNDQMVIDTVAAERLVKQYYGVLDG